MRTYTNARNTVLDLRRSVRGGGAHADGALPSGENAPPRSSRETLLIPLARIFGIVLMIGASWQLLPSFALSLAYFTDTEAGPARMESGLLDLTVTDPEAIMVGCGGMADATVDLSTDLSGFPSTVSASTTGLSGDAALCSALTLDARFTGATSTRTIYSGPLSGFGADGLGEGSVRLIASLPADADISESAQCTMDIAFSAWLAGLASYEDGGFTDREITQVTFSVEPGTCGEGGCEPPCSGGCGSTTVVVETHNDALVVNEVTASSHTGGNEANGGDSPSDGEGGDGGEIVSDTDSTTVNISNVVNSTQTSVIIGCTCGSSCGCATTTESASGTPPLPDVKDLLNNIHLQLPAGLR